MRAKIGPSTLRDGGGAVIWDRTWSYSQIVWAFVFAALAVRVVCAALTPLAFDEALYWRYSKHLAAGFLDHPGMNPLMIRIGTSLFGDTSLGVRIMAILLALPATWAVWRAGALLFKSERIGATAALFFNLTLVVTVGSMLATSDQVVVTATCFLLFFLAKLNDTDRGEWWLAIGAAFGLGMFSKYTTAFFAVSMFAWLVLVPGRRKWLLSPWSWAGGLLALIIFSPVLIWNEQHHWASLVYQSNRMVVHTWTLRYLGELIASQIGLATPPVFVLGCIGLFWTLRRSTEPRSARVLVAAMILPIVAYFVWHSLHERVQGNWPEPLYPAFAIVAAVAAERARHEIGPMATLARWSELSAIPFGVLLAGAIYAQALFAPLHLGPKDPTARILGFGWRALASEIEQARVQAGAQAIITTDYKATGWLTFYLPSPTPVIEINQRIRWANEPAPDKRLLAGPLLYVCKNECPGLSNIRQKFSAVALLDTFTRRRGALSIDSYSVYRAAQANGPVLDAMYADLRDGWSE
ncbi:MAG: glycosyl transferase [Alphaproteobacteria bacterium]|nr:glycosyl transferase [Alphaproteobacteria bacterium]